jgi:hypothetical protein
MYHVIHIFYVPLQPQRENILRISLKRLCNLLDESNSKNFVVQKSTLSTNVLNCDIHNENQNHLIIIIN